MSTRSSYAARPRAFEPGQYAGRPAPTQRPGWDIGPERRLDDGRSLARGLGWFSIGLGLAEVFMPEKLLDFMDVDRGREGLVRFYGFRELAAGAMILTQRTPTGAVYSRIAGDAVDLASLGAALMGDSRKKGNIVFSLAAVAGVTALDVICAGQLSRLPD